MNKPDVLTLNLHLSGKPGKLQFSERTVHTRGQALELLGQLSPADVRRTVEECQDVRVLSSLVFG